MNNNNNPSSKSGFTLVELIIVLGIIAVIIGVVIASVTASKNKALDAETRKTLSELGLKAEGQEIAPGVLDYQSAFTAINASSVLSQLAAKRQVTSGEYQLYVAANEYAIVFPLKKGGYYCIDSLGRAMGREVTALLPTSGPKNCSTALAGGGGGGGGGGGTTPPTLNLPSSDSYCGDSSYCTRVYSEIGLTSPISQGNGLINIIRNLVAQAVGDDGTPADGGGDNSIGISVAIDPDGKGNLLSDYLSRNITAIDGNGNDMTDSIQTQGTEAAAIRSVSGGPNYDFSHYGSAFPHRGGGQFTDCSDPYAFVYSVTDESGNTTTETHEYMTCKDVTFVNFDPLR